MANNITRYTSTRVINFQARTTYGVWVPPIDLSAVPDSSVATYVVFTGYQGRADLIANALYGDPRYDWILYAFNNVVDTINWPPSGLVIKYPIASYVLPRIA